jgi:hypothetical protein
VVNAASVLGIHLSVAGDPACGYDGNAILVEDGEQVTCPWCLGARSREEARELVERIKAGSVVGFVLSVQVGKIVEKTRNHRTKLMSLLTSSRLNDSERAAIRAALDLLEAAKHAASPSMHEAIREMEAPR